MAVSSSSYFSNSTVGVPQIAADFDVHAIDETPKWALGTKLERQDGAVFRYAHIGADITSAGLLLSPTMAGTVYTSQAQSIALTSSTYAMPEEPIGIYPNNKNSRYIIVKGSGVTADKYAGAYLTIQSGTTGQVGHTYRIRGNTATGTPLAAHFRCQLYEKLLAHYGSNSTVEIFPNKFSNLQTSGMVAAGSSEGLIVGVSVQSCSADHWVWVQTRGIRAVFTTGAAIASYPGVPATCSTDGGGLAVLADGVTSMVYGAFTNIGRGRQRIGHFVDMGSTSSFNLISLQLE